MSDQTLLARVTTLEAKVAELQARPTFVYRGTWVDSEAYAVGSFVTLGGSLWTTTTAAPVGCRPGTPNGSTAWVLCVKKGKDGKDARDA